MRVLQVLVLAGLALATSSFAQAAGIDGTWAYAYQQDGFGLRVEVTIQSDVIKVKNTCSYGGSSVSADVSAKIARGVDFFETLEAKSATNSNGEIDCDASIEVGRSYYFVDDQRLSVGAVRVESHNDLNVAMTLDRVSK